MLELDAFLRQKLLGFVVNVAEGAGFLFTHDQTFEAEPSYDRSQFGEAPTSKYDFCRVLVIKRFQLVSSLQPNAEVAVKCKAFVVTASGYAALNS